MLRISSDFSLHTINRLVLVMDTLCFLCWGHGFYKYFAHKFHVPIIPYITEELLEWKSSVSVSKKLRLPARDFFYSEKKYYEYRNMPRQCLLALCSTDILLYYSGLPTILNIYLNLNLRVYY
jgi:hypothetical protein